MTEAPGPRLPDSPAVIPAAAEQRLILEELLDVYAREFSRFHPVEFGADGRFAYPDLANYWRDPARLPFLIWMGGAVAGFILVQRIASTTNEGPVWDVAEFFVSSEFRRRSVATSAASIIWGRFPGRWQLRVLEANQPAMRFWERAVRDFTGREPKSNAYRVNNEPWLRFLLQSPSSSGC